MTLLGDLRERTFRTIIIPAYEFLDKKVSQFYQIPWINQNTCKDKKKYLDLHNSAKQEVFPEVDKIEMDNGFFISKEWFERLALCTQVTLKKSKINYQHGRILYSILMKRLKNLSNKDSVIIIETGTARGFSSIIMARALKDSGLIGSIFTFDVLPHNQKIYWNSIQDSMGKHTRPELLNDYAEELKNVIFFHGNAQILLPKIHFPRCHFAFIDAAHDYKSVLKEFEQISRYQLVGDVIFFDDYSPLYFPGVCQAVSEIGSSRTYSLETISLDDGRGYAIATKC